MACQAPQWLDVEFMQKALRSSENDDTIEVKNVTMQNATAIGDNYLSDMFRVKVVYSWDKSFGKVTDEKSVIVKIAPTGDNKDVIAELGIFNTEINMLANTLPRMNEMLEEEKVRLCARCIYTSTEDPPLIVMQDLSSLGFCMADRQAGLDLDHSILVMRGLARFHATSVAIRDKDPEVLNTYKRIAFLKSPDIVNLHKTVFKGISREILNWQELGSSRQFYSEKIRTLADVYFDRFVECVEAKGEKFIVLNHGDCWVNNMLFKYNDEGKVINHVFVDFQFTIVSSPAIDILNFVSASVSEDVAVNHFDTLLEEYLRILSKTMTRLNCTSKAPDMESLKKTLKKYQFLRVMISCLYLPFVLLEKSEALPMDEIMQAGDCYVNPALKTMAYRKRMVRLLKEWNADGSLDF